MAFNGLSFVSSWLSVVAAVLLVVYPFVSPYFFCVAYLTVNEHNEHAPNKIPQKTIVVWFAAFSILCIASYLLLGIVIVNMFAAAI